MLCIDGDVKSEEWKICKISTILGIMILSYNGRRTAQVILTSGDFASTGSF